MVNPEISRHISEQLAAGRNESDIRAALLAQNYPPSEIDAAFGAWKSNPTLPEKKQTGIFVRESWEILKAMGKDIGRIYLQFLKRASYFVVPIVVLYVIVRVLQNNGTLSAEIVNPVNIVLAGVGIICLIYLMIWLQATLSLFILNRQRGMSYSEAISEGKQKMGAFFWASLLSGLLTFLWALLLIIPGIIYGVYYTFAEYITLDKGLKGMDAVRKSMEYVKGMWWQVVYSFLGLGAVYFFIYIIEMVVTAIIGQDLGGIVNMLFSIVFVPYSLIYSVLVYEKLKSLKPEVA
jgi:hypothetical protein